jgi:hypothetical protein
VEVAESELELGGATTIWTVFVTTMVSVIWCVAGGGVMYTVRKDVFGGDVSTTVTVTVSVGEFPGPVPEAEPEPEPEPDPPGPPELPGPPGPEPPSMGTTE